MIDADGILVTISKMLAEQDFEKLRRARAATAELNDEIGKLRNARESKIAVPLAEANWLLHRDHLLTNLTAKLAVSRVEEEIALDVAVKSFGRANVICSLSYAKANSV